MYKFEQKLKTKATEFIEELKKKSLTASIANETLREYNIKIRIENIHLANLYYSGKKNAYTLVSSEITDIGLKNLVNDMWVEFNNSGYFIDTNNDSAGLFDKSDDSVHVYVDGSYYNNGYGYGFAVIENKELIFQEGATVPLQIFREQNNVGGELYGVLRALEWCKSNNKNRVVIYHDYNGISKFALGEWKARTDPTIYYAQQFPKLTIKPTFVKVAAHTNNKWNDLVDGLAKKGVSLDPLCKIKKEETTEVNFKRSEVASGFADFLVTKGIDAELIEVNNKYAHRVKIKLNSNNKILMDIYDCKRRKIDNPYLINIKGDEKKALLKHYNEYLMKNNLGNIEDSI